MLIKPNQILNFLVIIFITSVHNWSNKNAIKILTNDYTFVSLSDKTSVWVDIDRKPSLACLYKLCLLNAATANKNFLGINIKTQPRETHQSTCKVKTKRKWKETILLNQRTFNIGNFFVIEHVTALRNDCTQ